MKGVFNSMGTTSDMNLDSDGINNADGTGYGYHAGVLYEFSQNTRAGLSYHSQVVHHLTGTSDFTGPLAHDPAFDGPTPSSQRAKLNITLPPYTALSVYHRPHPQFAVMASAIYTQWNIIKNLILHNVAGIEVERSVNITVTIPQYFRNTWNLSLGGDYYATDKITLRTGVGFDQTPVSSTYRNVAMPDNNRYIVAFGGHYQATNAIGLDLGWMHLFMHQAHINPPAQITGDQSTVTNGSVTGGADVYSAQVTWDIA
jgi:long-chain fatty acid transport protein